MQFSVLGLNHNTAPVEVRERLAVADNELSRMYTKLLYDPRVREAVILSTCNRVEYYIVTEEKFDAVDVLYTIAVSSEIGVSLLRKHSYIHCGSNAIKHIVSVASGIDSLVLGEPQIFGQVKEAFRGARENKAIHSYINRLEQFVLRTTKKVRTDTGISENAVSISYAAVDLAKKIFGTLTNKKALIIGAGEMCELAVEHLSGAGIGSITVTNRTFSRAEELARRFFGRAVEFDKFPSVLHEADIVISSTGSPVAVVTGNMVKKAMAMRKKASMFFIDIAVPRDIAEDVNDISNVYLYDIDDLKQVVELNRKERENEAHKALELIGGAVNRFERSMESLAAEPYIVELRENVISVFEQEFEKYCRKNNIADQEDAAKLKRMLDSIAGKLLHPQVKALKDYVCNNSHCTMEEAVKIILRGQR